jgi:GNAT superfamily N-acetyltransferase
VAIEVLSAVGRWDHFAALLAQSGCVCMAYWNSGLDTLGRLEHMRNLCEREPGPGVLAFVDGEVADDAEAWSAVCFRVRSGFRRRGLMHDLLDGAIDHARASGAFVIEGYPVDPEGDRVDQTAAYVGTVGLFEAHGFERVLQTEGRSGGKRRWLVREDSHDLAGDLVGHVRAC